MSFGKTSANVCEISLTSGMHNVGTFLESSTENWPFTLYYTVLKTGLFILTYLRMEYQRAQTAPCNKLFVKKKKKT